MATIKAKKGWNNGIKGTVRRRIVQTDTGEIDEKNSTEADKLKHVRYTDLSEGKYVSKEKQRTYHDASSKVNTRILANDSSGIVTEDGLLEFGNL